MMKLLNQMFLQKKYEYKDIHIYATRQLYGFIKLPLISDSAVTSIVQDQSYICGKSLKFFTAIYLHFSTSCNIFGVCKLYRAPPYVSPIFIA